jgi:hypothetical protein
MEGQNNSNWKKLLGFRNMQEKLEKSGLSRKLFGFFWSKEEIWIEWISCL